MFVVNSLLVFSVLLFTCLGAGPHGCQPQGPRGENRYSRVCVCVCVCVHVCVHVRSCMRVSGYFVEAYCRMYMYMSQALRYLHVHVLMYASYVGIAIITLSYSTSPPPPPTHTHTHTNSSPSGCCSWQCPRGGSTGERSVLFAFSHLKLTHPGTASKYSVYRV